MECNDVYKLEKQVMRICKNILFVIISIIFFVGCDKTTTIYINDYEATTSINELLFCTVDINIVNNNRGDDVTSLLQNYLNECDNVIIPEGEYSITKSLALTKKGQIIEGINASSTIIWNDSNMSENSVIGKSTFIAFNTDITIRNLSIFGDQISLDGGIQELSGTGHGIVFDGMYGMINRDRFNCNLENLIIKNGYNGITIQNGEGYCNIKDVNISNCHHGLQLLNTNNINVENYNYKSEVFRSSNGWSKRPLTMHSGVKDINLKNISIEGGQISPIYIRIEDNNDTNERINIENVNIIGNEYTYTGIYFHNSSTNGGEIKDINITNLNISNVKNAIMLDGASQNYSKYTSNIRINKYIAFNVTNVFQHSSFLYPYTIGFNNFFLSDSEFFSNGGRLKGENIYLKDIVYHDVEINIQEIYE